MVFIERANALSTSRVVATVILSEAKDIGVGEAVKSTLPRDSSSLRSSE